MGEGSRTRKSLGLLKSDPAYQKDYDAILKVMDATDRIPFGQLDHGFVFNFWQDAAHPKGIWRRTTIADYANPAPQMGRPSRPRQARRRRARELGLEGRECTPSLKHCLINLSRGGGDAVVVREFDPDAKSFAEGRLHARRGQILDHLSRRGRRSVRHRFRSGLDDGLGLSAHRQAVEARHSRWPSAKISLSKASRPTSPSHRPRLPRGRTARHRADQRAVEFLRRGILFPPPTDATSAKLPLPLCRRSEGRWRTIRGRNLDLHAARRLDAAGQKPIPKGSLISFALLDFATSPDLPPIARALHAGRT